MATYVHLRLEERVQIYALKREGHSQAEIARRLGRDRATVSRELRRNAGGAGYVPHVAEQRYRARRHRCRRRPRLENRKLRRLVEDLLQRGLSPEQIAGRLRVEQGRTVVNPETIYRFVYESPIGRQEQLYQYLRRGKKKRTRRQGRRTHTQPIAGRLFIDCRPAAATERREIGHSESGFAALHRGTGCECLGGAFQPLHRRHPLAEQDGPRDISGADQPSGAHAPPQRHS